MDVLAMVFIVLRIANAMVGKTFLPDQRLEPQLLLRAEGESALDELTGFFQSNVFRRREDQVEVVRHDHEFVQEKTAFPAIVLKNVEKQARHFFFLEDAISRMCDGRYKEGADFLWSIAHGPPGLKPVIL